MGGHSGVERTYKRIKEAFYWRGMYKEVQSFVETCDICQQNKNETIKSPGLLQPLPIPDRIWTDISMDFVEGLPNSFGNSVIMVVVDRLTKAAHFIALAHPYTASDVAQAFLDNIYKLHGLATTIISDRDPIFTSAFWKALFQLQGTELCLSSSYHPQTDGQTEVINRCLENYLRCMTGDRPKHWAKWLPLAEWWYNTTYHASTGITPYEALYGQPPPSWKHYIPGTSTIDAVDTTLQDRQTMMQILKSHLEHSQNRMKQMADKHRSERILEVGDWVYLKLQTYRQYSVAHRSNAKLAPKYFGPFSVIKKVGPVAYELDLPQGSKIHPVFHSSQLKKKQGPVQLATQILPMQTSSGQLHVAPLAILARRLEKRHNKPVTMVLVQWSNAVPEDATWEPLHKLLQQFPSFQP